MPDSSHCADLVPREFQHAQIREVLQTRKICYPVTAQIQDAELLHSAEALGGRDAVPGEVDLPRRAQVILIGDLGQPGDPAAREGDAGLTPQDALRRLHRLVRASCLVTSQGFWVKMIVGGPWSPSLLVKGKGSESGEEPFECAFPIINAASRYRVVGRLPKPLDGPRSPSQPPCAMVWLMRFSTVIARRCRRDAPA